MKAYGKFSRVHESDSGLVFNLFTQNIALNGSFCLNISGVILTVQEENLAWVQNLHEANSPRGNWRLNERIFAGQIVTTIAAC